MKTRFLFNLGMVLWLGGRLMAAPTVGNDGATTTNLTRLSNLNGTAAATVSLESTNGVLVATQTNIASDMPGIALRTVWFLNTQAPTSGVYGVTADFKPAADEGVDLTVHRGGVMGWLDLSSRQGIALQVVPATPGGWFQVATVNFLAADDSANESFANLFNTNGTPASGDSVSASSDLGDYTPAAFATFQLDFAKPTTADLAAVSNATAHITAKVFQGAAGGAPVQVGRSIELLTDLPAPDAGVHPHRVGYFAYWANLFLEGSVIGELDNLRLVEGFAPATNQPPQVTITEPVTGTSATEPTDLTITAEASDMDGFVEQVVFLDGMTPLATNTAPPFSYVWLGVPVGTHLLRAEATDDRGAVATSTNQVTVTVNAEPGQSPELSIELVGPDNNSVQLSWPSQFVGYQLQTTKDLVSGNWEDSNTSISNTVVVTISGPQTYFRLKR